MKKFISALALLALGSNTDARKIVIANNCSSSLWVLVEKDFNVSTHKGGEFKLMYDSNRTLDLSRYRETLNVLVAPRGRYSNNAHFNFSNYDFDMYAAHLFQGSIPMEIRPTNTSCDIVNCQDKNNDECVSAVSDPDLLKDFRCVESDYVVTFCAGPLHRNKTFLPPIHGPVTL